MGCTIYNHIYQAKSDFKTAAKKVHTYINSQSSTRVKQIERCKEDTGIWLHSKLIAIGYNNYLCLNSMSENGCQHNSPQSQVQLKATYEFFF